MSITTMDQLVAAMAAATAERIHPFKLLVAQGSGGVWQSLWKLGTGVPGGASANPATGGGAAPDNTTAGAMKFTNAASGQKYLVALNGCSSQRGQLALYDRLVHTSGLDGTVTTAQTVNTVALPSRDAAGAANGAEVEAWLEVYTATGATGRTATVSYTNSAGTAGQSGSASIPNSAPAGRLVPVTLAAGDVGVRAVASVTLSGSTGTAGNFGVTLLRRIATVDLPTSNAPSAKNVFELGMPKLYSGSCLALMGLFDTTTSANVYAELVMVEG